ncbi:ABC transporter permease [Mesorhizobium kowhaii]|nr:ABC transporter permease [Mesorhizobium kowhaii]
MSQKLASYGQWTYRGAWALEIVAAIIGLTTGVALSYRGFVANEAADSMDLVLASAPFFMIAIAELTKIPIATLLFGASWFWKPVILVFLLVLAGITFETVLLGLERASTMREVQYANFANQTKGLQQEFENLKAAAESLRNTDDEAKARSDLEQLGGLADTERDKLRARITEVDEELQAATTLSPAAARAKEFLEEKQAALSALVERRDREIKDAVEQFERQRDSYVDRIKSARETGDLASVQRNEEGLNKLTNPRLKKEAEFAPKLAELEPAVAAARAEYEKLRKDSPPMTPQDKQRLEARRNDLEKLYDGTAADWDRKLDEARTGLAAAQEAATRKSETLAKNQQRQEAIATELSRLETERLPVARNDQIRRLAARWYGVKPEDVTEPQAGTVSTIWFASLAFIAALAGPITAMVALALQRIGAQPEVQRDSKLSRLLRRMLLRWRWRRVRKVPVQVPFDREVERRVEVPVEVEKIVKEILYVPVLTDDPEALRRALDRELPPEVIDLVKVSAKGQHDRIEKALEGDLQLDFDEPATGAKRGTRRARTT